MIVYCDYFCSQKRTAKLGAYLKSIAKGYDSYESHDKPLDYWRLRSLEAWNLTTVPHSDQFVLMRGGAIGRHIDPGEWWQVMLMIENPGWCIRGASQRVKDYPQPPGTLIVLDIERTHQVSGRSNEVWLSLNWNPKYSVIPKSTMSWQEALSKASKAYKEVLENVIED